MEKELWEPGRVRTVREAYYSFIETDLAYHFMCSRRLRYNVLGDQQRRMVFLKRLPPKIEAACRLQLPVSQLTMREPFQAAVQVEEALGYEIWAVTCQK